MSITKIEWIILLVSVFVALALMGLVFFIARSKIKHIKKEALYQQSKLGQWNKVITRKDAGELLWDLKDQALNPLEDVQLEFLINTAIRNDYQTCQIINADSDYEAISLKQKAHLSLALQPDLTVIFNKQLPQAFSQSYNMLKPKQMIAIVNANKKNKVIKNLLSYLKMIHAKYNFAPIGMGIILVVK